MSLKKRTLLRIALVVFAALGIGVYLLPSFAGSSRVRGWLLDTVLRPEGVEATIEDVQIGWFTPTKVRGVTLAPVGKATLLKADEIRSDRTLLSAITQGVELGSLTVIEPEIHVWLEHGSSNLEFEKVEHLVDPVPGNEQAKSDEEKLLRILVVDAKLFIKAPDMVDETQVFAGGMLNCTLHQFADHRRLHIEPGRLIDHAQLSPELCAGGLKYIMPILADATWTEGLFSIEIDECMIDLDDPSATMIGGRLLVHGIQAGIKNELLASATMRIANAMGREEVNSVALADNSEVRFRVENGIVSHDGVEFGLPLVSEDLVVRTRGNVSFDQMVDLDIDIPMPLHLIADGPIAQALTDKTLTLKATGPLAKPDVKVADDDFVAKMIGDIGQQLAEEEQPLRSLLQGFREAIGRDDDQPREGSFLDRLRERGDNDRQRPLRRLFGGGR